MPIHPSICSVEQKCLCPKHCRLGGINDLEDPTLEETMRLRTTIFATTAVAALAFGFSPPLLAQGANTQSGANSSPSTSQGASGGQARGSGNTAAPSTTGQANTGGQANGGRAQNNGGRAQNDVGLKSGKTETGAKIGSNNNATTVRERSRTRVSVYSGGREDVIVHRRRPHGMIVYNDEPSSRLIVRHHRPRNFVMYNDEPRRRTVVNERRPRVAISERTMTRSHAGGEINVRAGERSRETMAGSPSKSSPSQGSASNTSRQSSGSQAGETRAPGGNVAKQPSTTGQASH
jgi:hypothetical protein